VSTRSAVVVSLLVAFALGIFVAAPTIVKSTRDLGPSAYPAGDAVQAVVMKITGAKRVVVGPTYFFGLAIAVGVGSFFVVRRAMRRSTSATDRDRRRFLGGAATGAALGAGTVTAVTGLVHGFLGVGRETGNWSSLPVILGPAIKKHPEWKGEWKESRIAEHRRMGRTEFSVSDIALGSAGIHGELGERVVRTALDRGVNYIDTAPDYVAEGSERAIGKALVGRRDEVFLATKFCTPLGNLPAGTSPASYIAAVEASLQRLSTDRVDLIHIHGCDSIERLMDPNVHEAFERLREQGKVRFLGFSSHTPDLVKVANAAIESKRFDVMMLAYHHGIFPELKDVIHRGRTQADMGVVAMKTLKGAKHRGLLNFQPYADSYTQAALQWALGNPELSCAIISFREMQHVDEYLFASGKRGISADEQALLERYDRAIAGQYCPPHCGACLDSCPEGLAIHDVLRHRMYFEDYGMEKEAMRLYAGFEKQASVCVGCSAPCVGSCPEGIDIPRRTAEAHAMLTLAPHRRA
jgi:aryl-alcohol dehydrogenase-like predicted oxidoreductase